MASLPPDSLRPYRVLLIEDDSTIREQLTAVLSANGDFEVTAVGDIAAARAALAGDPPELIVSDLRLPDGLALNVLGEARERFPEVEILVISVMGDEATIVAAIAAGASGYLLKDAMPEDIRAAALEVLAGGSPISPSIARFIVRRAGEDGVVNLFQEGLQADKPHLTPREIKILWGIAKGLSYNEIADRLEISHNIVPTYIKAIYGKLHVGTRGKAAYEAIQYGLTND